MNLFPAGFGKFSPDVSLATGRNGSAHFGANVRTKWVAEARGEVSSTTWMIHFAGATSF